MIPEDFDEDIEPTLEQFMVEDNINHHDFLNVSDSRRLDEALKTVNQFLSDLEEAIEYHELKKL